MENYYFLKNKYYPKTLNDLCLDKKIIILLKNLIKLNNLNLLFISNPGTCKTTLINIILKYYYNDQFIDYDNLIDENFINDYSNYCDVNKYNENILYINSLKDNGISYYRSEVKTFCQTKSSIINKKKTIIIDDLDTINEQTQQIIRNYIDNYSSNINVLSSCNSIQKIIDPMQSRLNIIKINNINIDNMSNIFDNICKNEKMLFDTETKDYIINISHYSISTMINYIEKIRLLNSGLSLNLCKNICTNISYTNFEKYILACKNNDLVNAINIIMSLNHIGYSVIDILDNIYLFVNITNILTEEQKYEIIKIICKYIKIFHNIHENDIELYFFTNNIINILI